MKHLPLIISMCLTAILPVWAGVGAAPSATPPLPPALGENVALHFRTEIAAGVPFETTLTGIGPQFQSGSVVVVPQADGTKQYYQAQLTAVVSAVAGGYEVKVTFTTQVPEVQVVNNRPAQIVFKAVDNQATITLKKDEKQTAIGSSGVTMTLAVSAASVK